MKGDAHLLGEEENLIENLTSHSLIAYSIIESSRRYHTERVPRIYALQLFAAGTKMVLEPFVNLWKIRCNYVLKTMQVLGGH